MRPVQRKKMFQITFAGGEGWRHKKTIALVTLLSATKTMVVVSNVKADLPLL